MKPLQMIALVLVASLGVGLFIASAITDDALMYRFEVQIDSGSKEAFAQRKFSRSIRDIKSRGISVEGTVGSALSDLGQVVLVLLIPVLIWKRRWFLGGKNMPRSRDGSGAVVREESP